MKEWSHISIEIVRIPVGLVHGSVHNLTGHPIWYMLAMLHSARWPHHVAHNIRNRRLLIGNLCDMPRMVIHRFSDRFLTNYSHMISSGGSLYSTNAIHTNERTSGECVGRHRIFDDKQLQLERLREVLAGHCTHYRSLHKWNVSAVEIFSSTGHNCNMTCRCCRV